MDLAALKAQITGMSGSDEEIAAALNAMTVAAPDRLVPITEVMEYLRTNNLWLPIKAAQGASAGAAAAVDLNSDLRAQTIDFNLPIVAAMLTDLVSHGLLTQVQADAIGVKKKQTQSYPASIGCARPLDHGDILLARAA